MLIVCSLKLLNYFCPIKVDHYGTKCSNLELHALHGIHDFIVDVAYSAIDITHIRKNCQSLFECTLSKFN